jgi:hypothetical protein
MAACDITNKKIAAMRRSIFLACLILFLSAPATAEIEKIAAPSEKGFNLYWWPKLPPVAGWHHDHEHSLFYHANAFAPDGFTFKNAGAVIYASAIYKPREPEVKSIDALIANDKVDFEKNVSGVVIQEVVPISTVNGQKLRSFTFFPSLEGNWERVSYEEEGDFYLIFTISARSRSAYDAAVSAYEEFVSRYKR